MLVVTIEYNEADIIMFDWKPLNKIKYVNDKDKKKLL